jgi:peptide/nickel transport system ATP-binding protein
VISGLVDSVQLSAAPDVEREVLLELEDLVVDYLDGDLSLRAVDHVNLTIRAGEIVGLAGESGCGKTTAANAILGILRPPAEVTGGRIRFRGVDLGGLSRNELRRFRWRNVAMVFQSAMSALNPVMRVGDQFVDMMQAHERVSRRDALRRAGDLLALVGIGRDRIRAYPHELSGGMRQRVIIAMALALEPELVIMDEPTTALDVVVQREILQEVQQLQRELGFAVLFITHDLSLLLEFADRVAIMYAGEIVELAESQELFANALHPYSAGLLSSFPPLTGPIVPLAGIPGTPPDLADPPSGCRFHPRCPHCRVEDSALYARQTTERPLLKAVAPGHEVACHLAEESPS